MLILVGFEGFLGRFWWNCGSVEVEFLLIYKEFIELNIELKNEKWSVDGTDRALLHAWKNFINVN